jgi:hypothetical protein
VPCAVSVRDKDRSYKDAFNPLTMMEKGYPIEKSMLKVTSFLLEKEKGGVI